MRELRAVLPGREVVRARLTAPDLYRRDSRPVARLAGTTLAAVERRGKAIVVRGNAAGTPNLVVHLGMTGQLQWVDAGDTRRREPHLHARFHFRDGSELRYVDPRRFGFIFVGDDAACDASLRMGPDPFQLDARDLATRLGARRAPVKALLLDQHLISGMGNIYVDEALHAIGLHPLTPGHRAAARAGDLLAAARDVLTRAIDARGTTLRDYRRPDGSEGEFQIRLSVYGREGEPCPRCGGKIVKFEVAQRGTHVCPRCQRRPRLSASTRTRSAGR